MKLASYFFKFIYIIRKKVKGLKIKFHLLEYQYLFKERVVIADGLQLDCFPNFYLDQSNSVLVLNKNVSIRGKISFLFFNNGVIDIGENNFFNNNCSINCLDKIKIGNSCLFGENVKIYDHNHVYKNREHRIVDQGYTTCPVHIGNNCWIGSNVTVLKGVTIGNNCVIGAHCLINKNVTDNQVVVFNSNMLLMKNYDT